MEVEGVSATTEEPKKVGAVGVVVTWGVLEAGVEVEVADASEEAKEVGVVGTCEEAKKVGVVGVAWWIAWAQRVGVWEVAGVSPTEHYSAKKAGVALCPVSLPAGRAAALWAWRHCPRV